MKLRRLSVVAAGVAAALALIPTVVAAANGSGAPAVPSDSLRALAAKQGLRIGTAVDMAQLGTNKVYTDTVAAQFSAVTPENVMKWDAVEPTHGVYNWQPADQLVQFAEQHGQAVRGHTLMWHNQLPSWLTTGVDNGSIDNAQLLDILHQHITDEVSHFKGKIWQWDVVNEVFANSWDTALPDGLNSTDFWIQHLGTGVVADAFRWAHAADLDGVPVAPLRWDGGCPDQSVRSRARRRAWLTRVISSGVTMPRYFPLVIRSCR